MEVSENSISLDSPSTVLSRRLPFNLLKIFVELNIPISQKHPWVKSLNLCCVLLVPLQSSGNKQNGTLNLDKRDSLYPLICYIKSCTP